MSSHRRRQTRADRELMLDGRSGGRAPLNQLVDAARGPATPPELEGLSAALSIFRAGPGAADVPVPTRRARRTAGLLAGTGIGVKILLASLGAAALGGLGYTAVTGDLPGTSDNAPTRATTTSASHSPASSHHGQPSSPGNSVRSDVPSPSAALNGSCSSWFADARDPARASHARFSVLIQAAGGAANVDAYCTGVVNVTHPAHPSHPGQPSHPAHPTPTPATPSHTTGGPSGAGHTPTDHPSGPQNTKSHSPH